MAFNDEHPLLITLGFDASTFERLDQLRQKYFPPQRNQVPAHVTLFHHLPGREGDGIYEQLERVARSQPPMTIRFTAVKFTGRGVMLTLDVPELVTLRSGLARTFERDLTPQDRQPYHPHLTVMNKAERSEAERALREIQASWSPWSGTGDRLILRRYLGGPWDEVASYPFLGPARELLR